MTDSDPVPLDGKPPLGEQERLWVRRRMREDGRRQWARRRLGVLVLTLAAVGSWASGLVDYLAEHVQLKGRGDGKTGGTGR